MNATSIDHLPQELWRLIFRRIPHVSRLQCVCVSQKWYRFLKELEDELEAAKPRVPRVLFLGYKWDEDHRLQWQAVEPVSDEMTDMKLSWPPGWDPAVHGGIQGGGRSGLVALWDNQASQYWVGNPVHDKWETVPEMNVFQGVPFHRQGFHFIPEGRRHKRRFWLKPAVPCFEPVKKRPSEDKGLGDTERSGFYRIVQFQLNETHERRPVHDRKVPNWVIQVYSSESRSWKILGEPALAVRALIHSCVSGDNVYFLAAMEPVSYPGERLYYVDKKYPCPLSVWVYQLDSGLLFHKLHWLFLNDEIEMYWRSMQLRVTKGGDLSIIAVGHPRFGVTAGLYKIVGDEEWDIEKHIELDDLYDGDTGFDELIDSDSQDWGFNFMPFNLGEGHLDDLYGFAHKARKTMYTKKNYLASVGRRVSDWTNVLSFSKQGRLWKYGELLCPLYKDGVLPIATFLPCCDLPCCT